MAQACENGTCGLRVSTPGAAGRSVASVTSGCGTRHLIGLGFVLLSGALPQLRDGLLVAHSNQGLAYLFLTRRGFGAITFGRVVVSAIPLTPRLLMHESHHARQYEHLGPFFLPIYLWLHARR